MAKKSREKVEDPTEEQVEDQVEPSKKRAPKKKKSVKKTTIKQIDPKKPRTTQTFKGVHVQGGFAGFGYYTD